jgi:hypothetical protein
MNAQTVSVRKERSVNQERVVFVKCKLSAGSFPTERIFKIEMPNDGELYGTAPLNYCYTTQHKPLAEKDAATKNEVAGRVAGIRLAPPHDGKARVYLPNGEVYEIQEDQIEPAGEEAEASVAK